MGGPPKTFDEAQRMNAETARTQADIGRETLADSREDRARRVELQQFLIDKEKALASGDPKAALAAMAPALAQVSRGYAASRDQIMSSIPPGAARDVALAELERDKGTAIGGAMATEVNKAPEILANVGAGLGAFSLQELGASLRGYEGSANTGTSVAQTAQQAKASQLGFLGSLAQSAGGVASSAIKASDATLKTNLRPLPIVVTPELVGKLKSVKGFIFDYANGPSDQIGVIAQDLQRALPEAVIVGEDGKLQVHYGLLAAVALQAVHALVDRIERG